MGIYYNMIDMVAVKAGKAIMQTKTLYRQNIELLVYRDSRMNNHKKCVLFFCVFKKKTQ